MRMEQQDPMKKRDEGIRLVLSRSDNLQWQSTVADWISSLETDRLFTSDEVVDACGLPPGHRNAIGAAVRTAITRNQIIPVGFTASRRPSARGRAIRIYMVAR